MLIGLVGKPNIGKSTFFRAATLAPAQTGNYPFVTIKPNFGKAMVRVKQGSLEFNKQDNPKEGYTKGEWRFVPVDIMDVAGLVPGAHEGLGMGNAFLDDLRQADVLIHVIDCSGSTNEKGEPVTPGSYDPLQDIAFLEKELDYWYLGILKKGWEKFARTLQQTHAPIAVALAKQLSGLGVTEHMVQHVIEPLQDIAVTQWSEDQLLKIAQQLRKKTKPIVIAANKVDMPQAQQNVMRIKQECPHYTIIGCSAESEIALREAHKHGFIDYTPGDHDFSVLKPLSEKQEKALDFMRQTVLLPYESTGIQAILDHAVFNVLEYIALFPGGSTKLEDSQGRVLPDCFLMPKHTTAIDFAFKLHTDFGTHFIKAIDVRKKIPVGKDHVLHHRDIIEIMSNS
ncbi:MAG: redox-regulated ATPase YchF [Candidatus Woesearchaeota archaeon]